MTANPFNVTKAVDFSDEQIAATWVDFAGAEGGFFSIADPTSPMPRILIGGKGTGRTHLMRYFSAPLQLRRHSPAAIVADDRYLGIYLRCSGLNGGRFTGKGIDDETWGALFIYYMDLWLGELALRTAVSAFSSLPDFADQENAIVKCVSATLDDPGDDPPADLPGLLAELSGWRRQLDLAINNAALTREVTGITIRAAQGRLPMSVPQAIAEAVPRLADILWLYLLDELENLTEAQQRYVQTLLREKEAPTSFLIGSRRDGFRTRRTLAADEENRAGSEFDELPLDRFYLRHDNEFEDFCRRLIAQRLVQVDRVIDSPDLPASLDSFFDTSEDRDVTFVPSDPGSRRHLATLQEQLARHTRLGPADVLRVVALVTEAQDPILEKLNVLILYQRWSRLMSGPAPAEEIATMCRAWRESTSGQLRTQYHQKLKHHESDLYAQLRREYSQPQLYVGMQAFVRMAGGLPRNLLIILKNIYRWTEFQGERAFTSPVSISAQREGVRESSDWFLRDNLPLGAEGDSVERSIMRLGTLFRALRFSHRPPEVHASAFSVDGPSLRPETRRALDAAERASMLLPS